MDSGQWTVDSGVSAAKAADRALPTKRGAFVPRTKHTTVHSPQSTLSLLFEGGWDYTVDWHVQFAA